MTRKRLTFSLAAVFILLFTAVVPIGHSSSSETVEIIRDNYGVPHIFASTKRGLGFGCGYAVAQDRLWQADLYRRQAFGSLAEFGLASVATDLRTRTEGYSREELRYIFDSWNPSDPEIKPMMLAYVDGLNLYISQALQALAHGDTSLMPAEYLALQHPLKPFTIEDCVAITVMMAQRFGGTGGDELRYASALDYLVTRYGEEQGWEIFNDLYPQQDPGAPVTIPSVGCWGLPFGMFPKPPLSKNVNDIYIEEENARIEDLETFKSMGLPTKFGSNAWMVNPKKSETGNALEVGGPQMGQSIPQIVTEVGLHGAGINAVGMMMPQGPFILIGVSEYGAWTSTTGASDTKDTYMEVLNPANPHQYMFQGTWHDMEKRTETIYNASGYPFAFDIYRTVHGPVFQWDVANNLAYSRKWPYWMKDLEAEEGWMLWQETKTIFDFYKGCSKIMPSHNFFWIDKFGNIAYAHAGRFPIKPEFGKDGRLIDDRLPLWGTGEEEWVGLTGFREMPKCINPKQGWLTNWNNKPVANWPYAESDYQWGEGHRVEWIQELLAAGCRFSFEDMNRINRDAGYNHIAGMNFLNYLIEAAKTDPSIPSTVIDYLEAWNHHYNDANNDGFYDDQGLTIFDAWYARIFGAVFADDVDALPVDASTLIHVFDGSASKLPLNYDYLNDVSRDVVIVSVLKNALAYLTTKYGPDMSKWLSQVARVTFQPLGLLNNPSAGQPKLTMHAMNRGTYNQIVEMPRWRWCIPPHAVNVIPPGQSGFINITDFLTGHRGPHIYDQLPLYETWQYKPMLYRRSQILDVAESIKTLTYP